MIVISSDDEEQEVSPVDASLQLDASEGDELLPTMMSPPAISPPKNVEAQWKGTSPPACAIEQLETLTRILESEMPVLMTPQSAALTTQPSKHASKTVEAELVAQAQLLLSGSPLTAAPQLTAQNFADYVAQSNQTSANVSPAAQQSHHIQMLFVEFLKMYAKYIPAWTAIMPFCERHGVPAQARAQLILQLQPIANKFEEMKSTAGQYYLR
uniref:Uncharacterized protein n=1 Tax=Ditylenchus dipsaci TaxID=166011 RepID=A0A915EV12_9BILA